MIRRTFKLIDKEIFALLFKSRVRPILEYGNTIWSPRLKKDIDAIERVQRVATNTVPGLATLPYPERLRVLNLPSLIYRRARGDMIETYKYQPNVYDIDNEWLKPETSTVTIGHMRKLIKPRCNSTLRLHCFSHRVVNHWNSLPANVVSAPSVNAFKSRLDNHWQTYQGGGGEAVIDKTTTKIRTSTSELCTRGIDTCTLVTMVGQILTTVCWHCGMVCLAIG